MKLKRAICGGNRLVKILARPLKKLVPGRAELPPIVTRVSESVPKLATFPAACASLSRTMTSVSVAVPLLNRPPPDLRAELSRMTTSVSESVPSSLRMPPPRRLGPR